MADKWTPWKAKMTRATKSGDITKARKVVDDFQAFCEVEGYPDWWMDIFRRLNDMEAIHGMPMTASW